MRIFCLVVAIAACACGGARTFGAGDRATITAIFDAQRDAWNRGDLAAYMDHYAKLDGLVFTSGSKIRRGWKPTFDYYQRKYGADPAGMGTLAFELLSIDPVGADGAVVLGTWRLAGAQTGDGVFSVVVERRPEGWRIVHDHTSSSTP
jgi:beta-aspartyl-peptidase (threonine type)